MGEFCQCILNNSLLLTGFQQRRRSSLRATDAVRMEEKRKGKVVRLILTAQQEIRCANPFRAPADFPLGLSRNP